MEKELIIAAKNGNREAFSKLVQIYLRRIYKTAYFFLRNVDDAEDVCQTTFMNAYRHIKTFNESKPLFPYLYRTVKNTCINQLRKKQSSTLTNPKHLKADPKYSPEQIAENSYSEELLHRALDKLPPDSREILMLKYWNNLGYREIAEVLSIPEGTVMSRIFYARKKLRNLIIQLEGNK